jgi:hypothetical protein
MTVIPPRLESHFAVEPNRRDAPRLRAHFFTTMTANGHAMHGSGTVRKLSITECQIEI